MGSFCVVPLLHSVSDMNVHRSTLRTYVYMFVPFWRDSPPVDQSLLTHGVSRSHNNDAPHSVGLLWTGDQLVAEISTRKPTTLTTEKHPCPR